MNKKELEKMFNEKYWDDMLNIGELRQFIFETLIPEVLKSIIQNEDLNIDNYGTTTLWDKGFEDCLDILKQKAKELYGITL